MNDDDALPFGLYELVESAAMSTHRFPPQAQADWAEVNEAERISVFSRCVAAQLEHRLKLAGKKDRVDIVNRALAGIYLDDEIRWGAQGELRQFVALRPRSRAGSCAPRLLYRMRHFSRMGRSSRPSAERS